MFPQGQNSLGRGAAGRISKTLYIPSCQIVALKRTHLTDDDACRQTRREISGLLEMIPEKPQLLQIFACWEDSVAKELVVACEYMDRGSLKDYMESSNSLLTEDQLRQVARQVCLGLYYLHTHVEYDEIFVRFPFWAQGGPVRCRLIEMMENIQVRVMIDSINQPNKQVPTDMMNGIQCVPSKWVLLKPGETLRQLAPKTKPLLHRDLKPSNILCAQNGEVKIADFGLLHQMESPQHLCTKPSGTRKYFSPEHLCYAEGYGPKVDIWALGVTLYECSHGLIPELSSELELELKIREGTMVPSINTDALSPEACDFMRCCLAKDQADRWTAVRLLAHPFLQTPSQNVSFGPAVPDWDCMRFIIQAMIDHYTKRERKKIQENQYVLLQEHDEQRLQNIARYCKIDVKKVSEAIVNAVQFYKR